MSADDTKVVNLNDYKQNKLDEDFEKEFYIEFTPDFSIEGLTVDTIEMNFEDLDVKLEGFETSYVHLLEQENQKEAAMHIANLLEVVDYNVDWNNAPDWHRTLRDQALDFYKQFYGKE